MEANDGGGEMQLQDEGEGERDNPHNQQRVADPLDEFVCTQGIVRNLTPELMHIHYNNWKLYMKTQGLQHIRSTTPGAICHCSFINRSKWVAQVLWINEHGFPTVYGQLMYNQVLYINSYAGHPWIVRNGITGEVLLVNGKTVFHPKGNHSRVIVRKDVVITDPVLPLQELCAQVLLHRFAISSRPDACLDLIQNLRIPMLIKAHLNTKILLNIIYRRNIGGQVGRGPPPRITPADNLPEFAEPRRPIRPQVLYPIAQAQEQGQEQNQRQGERAGVAASGNRRRARPVSPDNEEEEDVDGQIAGRRSGRRAAGDNQQQQQRR